MHDISNDRFEFPNFEKKKKINKLFVILKLITFN